jgi:hypothetical protein
VVNLTKKFCEFCGEKIIEGEYNCFCRDNKFDLEEYESDLSIQAGWAQQDIIDMYRREQ